MLCSQGDYDDILPWPFAAKVSLVLIDQSSSRRHLVQSFHPDSASSSFQKPRDAMNVASGCPEFVPHGFFETTVNDRRSFVQNDVVYFKIVVDKTDLRTI